MTPERWPPSRRPGHSPPAVTSAGARRQENAELYIYSYATPVRFDWEAIDVLKAISCYEYQACEAPGWDTSAAKVFAEGLRRAVIPALPGYTDAPWEITTTSTPAATTC